MIEAKDIDWTKAPEGYDYYIVDKNGSITSDFHKKAENALGEPCYEDPDGYHWDTNSPRMRLFERPSGIIEPTTKYRFHFMFQRTAGTPVWTDKDVKLAEIVSTSVGGAEQTLRGLLPEASSYLYWAIELIKIESLDTQE